MFQAALVELVILRMMFQATQLGDLEDDNTKKSKARLGDLEAQVFEGTCSTRPK